jgi:anaerobic ribonucleoside-triphosphate reductase activating protein
MDFSTKLRVAGIVQESYVDGPGIRMAVFVQGCNHCCSGCQNPHTWDYDSGYDVSIEKIINDFSSNPLLNGITFTGGEPIDKAYILCEIADIVKNKFNKSVWCYTGYTFEELMLVKNNTLSNFLNNIDVLVDGPFVLDKRDLNLLFRGSSNQRIIDVQESLKANKVILWKS